MAELARVIPVATPLALHPSSGQPSRAVLELHHDLRQPLNAIRALVAAAQTHDGVPDTVLSCLDHIDDEASELLALCRHVLGRSEAPQPTAVGHLAEAVAQSCRRISGATIEVEAQPALVVVDEVELRRALWNLLENATRAAGADGRVRVTVTADGDVVRISVGDSGPGFARGPKGTASLGLAIVNRLVRRRSGRVEVGTSDLGGTLVSLVLPTAVIDLVEAEAGRS